MNADLAALEPVVAEAVLVGIVDEHAFGGARTGVSARSHLGRIDGKAFEGGNTVATLFAWTVTLPSLAGGRTFQIFDGLTLDRVNYLFALSGVFLLFVLINVAAMESLRGDHSVLSRELRRYSRASLSKLLTGAGFSIERITYTNAILFPAMAVARALQRRRGLSAEEHAVQEIAVPPGPINVGLSLALKLESLWLGLIDNPFGSSLLCLARKPA